MPLGGTVGGQGYGYGDRDPGEHTPFAPPASTAAPYHPQGCPQAYLATARGTHGRVGGGGGGGVDHAAHDLGRHSQYPENAAGLYRGGSTGLQPTRGEQQQGYTAQQGQQGQGVPGTLGVGFEPRRPVAGHTASSGGVLPGEEQVAEEREYRPYYTPDQYTQHQQHHRY